MSKYVLKSPFRSHRQGIPMLKPTRTSYALAAIISVLMTSRRGDASWPIAGWMENPLSIHYIIHILLHIYIYISTSIYLYIYIYIICYFRRCAICVEHLYLSWLCSHADLFLSRPSCQRPRLGRLAVSNPCPCQVVETVEVFSVYNGWNAFVPHFSWRNLCICWQTNVLKF